MRIKLFQFGWFYVRLDITFLDGLNTLLGLCYCEGEYIACTDTSLEDCKQFTYSEVQIGLLFLNIAIGKELENG